MWRHLSACLAAGSLCVRPLQAQEGCHEPAHGVDQVVTSGNSATADGTLLALLPRPPPTRYTPAELAELERRLNNLGIFDRVGVECSGSQLQISVREKWTLVPEVDFASGQSLEDSSALLGVTEYNLLGTANQLTLSAYRERRGFGFAAAFSEHDYGRHRWAFSSEASFGTAQVRFEDDSGWKTTSLSLELAMRSPPWLSEHFNYVAGLYGSREQVHAVERTAAPSSSQVLQSFMGFSWDSYQWHDLVPHGLRASLWLSTGGLFSAGPPEPRHTAVLLLDVATALGEHTALVSRAEAAVGTRGNVNYGFLLGSVDGVRGLRDSFYLNWVHAFANVELRQSFLLRARWALQGVLFADAALFEPMDAEGRRGRSDAALALGAGVRLLPTWLSSVVLRLDASRLIAPEPAWFTQLGLNQYF